MTLFHDHSIPSSTSGLTLKLRFKMRNGWKPSDIAAITAGYGTLAITGSSTASSSQGQASTPATASGKRGREDEGEVSRD